MTTRPENYRSIPAHQDQIEKAREIKEERDLTWSEYIELSAEALENDTEG